MRVPLAAIVVLLVAGCTAPTAPDAAEEHIAPSVSLVEDEARTDTDSQAPRTPRAGDWVNGTYFDARLDSFEHAGNRYNGTFSFRFHNGTHDLDIGYPEYPQQPTSWTWSYSEHTSQSAAWVGVVADPREVSLRYAVDGWGHLDYVYTWSTSA